jgi:hypothetical protein
VAKAHEEERHNKTSSASPRARGSKTGAAYPTGVAQPEAAKNQLAPSVATSVTVVEKPVRGLDLATARPRDEAHPDSVPLTRDVRLWQQRIGDRERATGKRTNVSPRPDMILRVAVEDDFALRVAHAGGTRASRTHSSQSARDDWLSVPRTPSLDAERMAAKKPLGSSREGDFANSRGKATQEQDLLARRACCAAAR